jgi:hypothetical protein
MNRIIMVLISLLALSVLIGIGVVIGFHFASFDSRLTKNIYAVTSANDSSDKVISELENELLAIVSNKRDQSIRSDRMTMAIKLLGKIRSPKATKALLNVHWYSSIDENERENRFGRLKGHKFTAIRALIEHGEECIPRAVDFLRQGHCGEEESAIISTAILIKSINPHKGADILELAIRNENDDGVKKRLSQCLVYMRTTPSIEEMDKKSNKSKATVKSQYTTDG